MAARGERIIEAGGREVRILFTNQALAEAEQRMNKSVLGVARELLNGQAGVGDVAQLLRAGMQASNRDEGRRKETVSLPSVFKLMDAVGFTVAMTAVLEAVTAVLTYKGEDEAGEGEDPNS